MNKQAEEQNVFAVVNDVFEIVSKPFYGDRQIAEVRLKEAAKVINSYCTAHAQAEKERAVREALEKVEEEVVLHYYDTTVGRKIDEFIQARLAEPQKGDSDG